MAMTATQNAFSQFVSSKPCVDQSNANMDSKFCKKHEGAEIQFDQVLYSETRGIESVAIAYETLGANRLTFAHRRGLQIHLRVRGTGIYSFNRSDIVTGAAGEMQVFCASQPWQKHVFERPETKARTVAFWLPQDLAEKYIGRRVNQVYRGAENSFYHARQPIRRDMLGSLNELFSAEETGLCGLRRDARLLDVFVASVENFRENLVETDIVAPVHPSDVARIKQAENRIWDDLANYPGVAGLAIEFGMSKSKFKTVFKQVTQCSVGEYVREARMQMAATLLRKNHQIAEVAHALGYKHLGHFAQTFRNKFNVTPSQYRAAKNRFARRG